jgi:hypothetical protein
MQNGANTTGDVSISHQNLIAQNSSVPGGQFGQIFLFSLPQLCRRTKKGYRS